MKQLFNTDMDIRRLIKALEIETATQIDPHSLLIFDEIQESPDALSALKYFCELLQQQAILAAGSLLGVAIKHSNLSFPVGKVDFLNLYPLTFEEFLVSTGEDGLLLLLKELDLSLLKTFRERLIHLLKTYFYVGGMPEAVVAFTENGNFPAARDVQNSLLRAYLADFSKHISAVAIPKLHLIWDSLASQLAKGNKKFIYCALEQGQRSSRTHWNG